MDSPIKNKPNWPTESVFFACYFSFIVATISILVTSLAILAYFHSASIRQAYQNLLMLALLINAMIYSVNAIAFYGPGAIMKNFDAFSIGFECSLIGFIGLFCTGMETYILMCIALERYFAIKRQTPLTFNQIIGLLIFGICWIGFMTSLPYWNSSFYFTLSDSKLYCTYAFSDQTQLIPTTISSIHVTICISVICFCYFEIYRFCMKWKKHTGDNIVSTLNPVAKKETDKEFRILWTTIMLVGWTFIGWSSMLIMITCKVMTGSIYVHWDIVSALMLIVAVCGDSIILLSYDKRWRTSLKEIMSSIRGKFGSMNLSKHNKN